MKTNSRKIEWYEDLPEECPPNNSDYCNGTYFRISLANPANTSDFYSQRKQNPSKQFKGVDECTTRALSVFDSLDAAKLRLRLPKFRKAYIAEITLEPQDGKILKTFGPQHYSWWRSKNFDVNKTFIIPNIELL